MTFIDSFKKQRQGVWDEELLCDVKPIRRERVAGARSNSGSLRLELSARNLALAAQKQHELTRGVVPSVVYAPNKGSHGNFIDASYKRICENPDWLKRLKKVHTAKRQARPMGAQEEVRLWCELDAATSSDALLMNVFCYPRVFTKELCTLLGIGGKGKPEFGYKPQVPLVKGLKDRTEVDMRLPGLTIEAKLTESNFQRAPMALLERYPRFNEVFDRKLLVTGSDGVESYQLIRGVMAAQHTGERFCVLCDARRPDLLEAWFMVMRAVRLSDVA